ncbi:MAG: hypothetical protein ACHQAZ_09625 [Gammaproteobacteria bacterium]
MLKLNTSLVFMGVVATVLGASPGTAISAPPSNTTLQAEIVTLQNKLTALTTKVTSLTTKVSKLQGNITASDLAGTYTMIGTALEQTVISGGNESGFAENYITSINTVILDSNNTFTVTSNNYTYSFSANIATCCTAGDAAVADPLNTSSDGGSGTWSYSGGILTLTPSGGSAFTLTAADGGRMFVAVLTDSSGAPQATTMVRNN